MNTKKSRRKATQVKPVAKSFNCPSCGATLNITAVGRSITVVCKSCRTVLDATDPNFSILEKAHKSHKVSPAIPIGSRGTVGGKMWECIGFMQRGDSYGYRWHEYLLFNPYHGYRWLFEFDGHWTWFKRSYELPDLTSNEIEYKDQSYKLFTKGSAEVFYVVGEFYWRVKVGDKSKVKDFISPPYTVSSEKVENEEVWTFGQYLEPERIKKAFKLDGKYFPEPVGIAPNQPSPHKAEAKKALKLLFFAACFMITVHIFRSASSMKKEVFHNTWKRSFPTSRVERAELKKAFNTRPFELTKKKSNVKLKGSANVNNSWIWIDALLVNEQTGKGIPMPMEISYYHGYSGGESWREGSHNSSRVIQNIPPGRYYLSIKTQVGGKTIRDINYSVSLIQDVPVLSNLIISLILIGIFPIFKFFRRHSYEVQRWSTSDYSPYSEE
ncbi:MAG: DUF4178 domain-containing protein [Bacteriovoracaceae bacterium]|nr:DUF4178 domain-containing protein [Bacteriovoracaceae bacterium]